MTQTVRIALVSALLAFSFAGGYALARWQARPADPASRVVLGAVVPPGLASDLRDALLIPDTFERTAAVSRLLAPLGPESLPDVRAAYDGVIIALGDIELVQFVEWWGRFDPEGAYTWAKDSRIGWHPAVLQSIFRSWARRDAQAATAAIGKAPLDANLLRTSMIGLVSGWDESRQGGLEEFLVDGTAAGGEAFPLAVDALARKQLLRGGPQAAMDWADGLPDADSGEPSALKVFATQRLAGILAEQDPALAADFVASKPLDVYGVGLLLKLGTTWADRDGEAAMAWAARPEVQREPVVVQETYRKWLTNDLAAAGQWLEAQKLEPWLDPAVFTYAEWRTLKSYEEALDWAGRIHDPERREAAIAKIAFSWLRESQEAAEAWLARADLPDKTRQRIAKLRSIRINDPQEISRRNQLRALAGKGAAEPAPSAEASAEAPLPGPVADP